MGRYILRFKGLGKRPECDVQQVKESPGITIVEEAGKMLLIEGTVDGLRTLASKLPSWVLREEQDHKLPGQVPRVKAK